jgi:hypothetical protein
MANFNLKATYIEYDVNFITYDTNGFITSSCNTITFYNLGSNVATIEQIPLQQGQSFSIDGNAGEIIRKQFLVTFTGTGTNQLLTIQKNYL